MEIMELAAELGKKIKDDPRLVALKKAEEAYEADKELQKMIIEYNAQSTAMTEAYKNEKHDDELIKAIEMRINTLYHAIVENANMIAYQQAQEVVNAFMNEVNGEISFQITGQRPCSHDCSSCHADCGHNH